MILFLVLAVIAIAAILAMLLSNNAVYSALFLVVNFVTVAVIYLTLGAPFIALVQITVYAGAIMVLFLFVIMLLGAEKLSVQEPLPWQRPLAIGFGVVMLAEVIYVTLAKANLGTLIGNPVEGFGSPASIGLELYNQYLLPFEVTSILLLVAVVGAIVLTRPERIRKEQGKKRENAVEKHGQSMQG